MAESLTKKLQRFFSIGIKTDRSTLRGDQKSIVPTSPEQKDSGEWSNKPLNLPSEIQRMLDAYINQNYDTADTLKNRFDRYDDLDYMMYNDPIMSMTADLYADEGAQADAGAAPVLVEAKNKTIKNYIENLLQTWGIDQNFVRETIWNEVVFGESFDINSIDPKEGITDVTRVDVRTIKERIEFKASEVAKQINGESRHYVNKEPSLQTLIDEIENPNNDFSKSFKAYLFGFIVEGDQYLPPWAVTHYRMSSSKSEFWPYGRSLFINLIAPFRQIKTAKNFLALARALKIPKEAYEVNVSENMSEVEKWEAVNEARMEFQNQGINNRNKDDFSATSEIWLPKGFLEHRSITSDIRIEDIKDIELLRDDMIIGSRVPKGYLIVDRSSFGTSGQSLLQQHKPFGRATYSAQSVFLAGLAQKIKTHLLITEEFDKEFTDFELSMEFPVVEESQDHLRMKQDSLRLANDVISNIQSALGTRDGLPPDVIRMVFSKLSFIDPDDMDDIMDKVVAGLGLEERFKTPESELPKRVQESFKSARERISEDIIQESVREIKKERNMQEGILNCRHYVSSHKTSPEETQVFSILREKKERDRERLNLQEDSNY